MVEVTAATTTPKPARCPRVWGSSADDSISGEDLPTSRSVSDGTAVAINLSTNNIAQAFPSWVPLSVEKWGLGLTVRHGMGRCVANRRQVYHYQSRWLGVGGGRCWPGWRQRRTARRARSARIWLSSTLRTRWRIESRSGSWTCCQSSTARRIAPDYRDWSWSCPVPEWVRAHFFSSFTD